MLGVSVQRVGQLIRSGQLEGRKVSGVWLVDEASVEKRIRSTTRAGGRPRRGFARHETWFVLRNRTHDVVELVYNSNRGEFTWMGDLLDAQRAPLGVIVGNEGPGLPALNSWWRGRGIPRTRVGIDEVLREDRIDVPEALVSRNLGLSLSDQYWIWPVGSSLRWEDINFFHSDFETVSAATEPFAPGSPLAAAHPDNTTDGDLAKTWEIVDGIRTLFKRGRGLNQEPYNEVVATALHRRLLGDGEFVPYELAERDGAVVCACPCFLSDEEEYIPAFYVDGILPRRADQDAYVHYLSCCKELGITDMEHSLWKTIVCDDILANPDRHWRNFGIVRNVNTLQCRPAPLFDSGEGLWCHSSLADLRRGEHSFESKQFHPNPARQLLLVDTLRWLDTDALDGFVDEAMGILARNDLLEERLDYVRRALEWRIFRIRDIAEWE